MNNTKNSQKWIGPLCIFLLALSVFTAHRYQMAMQEAHLTTNGLNNSCDFINNQCELKIVNNLLVARFSTAPEVEESITLIVEGLKEEQIESAWIEGVNMYMGKIPVLMERKESGKWEGWFMLGSCSEPTMHWQLRINVVNHTTPLLLNFSSTQ